MWEVMLFMLIVSGFTVIMGNGDTAITWGSMALVFLGGCIGFAGMEIVKYFRAK